MSLCRYLPTPSDRMAVMWTLLNVGQAVVLEYGPAGTTHYSMGLFGNMGISPDQTLFTTHMSEDDVVMGDVSRLERALVEIEELTHRALSSWSPPPSPPSSAPTCAACAPTCRSG